MLRCGNGHGNLIINSEHLGYVEYYSVKAINTLFVISPNLNVYNLPM